MPSAGNKLHVAYHEAGHAVADVRFGFRSRRLCFERRADPSVQPLTLTELGGAAKAQNYIVSLLVGIVAEVTAGADADRARSGAEHDLDSVEQILRDLGEVDREGVWIERTRAFIREPKNRSALQVVAAAMLEHLELDGNDVERLVRQADVGTPLGRNEPRS